MQQSFLKKQRSLGKALAEKPSIWAVSGADTAQIEGVLRDHPAAVFPDKGTKLGQGLAQALAEKPSIWAVSGADTAQIEGFLAQSSCSSLSS